MTRRVVTVPEWLAVYLHGLAVGVVAGSIFSLLWRAVS